MREIFSALVEILRESSPYLILGFALAGVIHVLLHRYPRITAQLTGPGRRPVFLAALLGAPMPLCSCSVLPAAMALRRQGASKGTTASFLVSVPETDIVSVLVTLALIGPFFAVYRPLAAVASALATGLVIRSMERREHHRAAGTSTVAAHDPCCADDAPAPESAPRVSRPWWVRAFRYGFIEMFDDIAPQVFLGVVVAAILGVLLPDINPDIAREHRFLTYLVMVAVGIPLYVCAAASTPIAAGLIAGGVSPGAAMVFLLAGPATNAGSLVVLRGEFGARILAAYIGMIALTSIALGALLDAVLPSLRVTVRAPAGAAHEHVTAFSTAAMLVFLLWTLVSFHRSRLLPRARARITRALSPRPSAR
ncbi:MAG TPA: SO_0444 family Cu/Zn efflux transporter [Candidatus Krumholzibacteria bacterium]